MSESPRVLIDLSKLVHNFQTVRKHCRDHGLEFTTVLKATAGDQKIARVLLDAGMIEVGDSRIENLEQLRGITNLRKILLRLPPLSRTSATIAVADCSLNSETIVLSSLNQAAATLSKRRHQVFLMVDQGDLREGVNETELASLARYCRKLNSLEVIGLGSNFSCFAGVKPTTEKLQRLVELARNLREEFQLPVTYVSGGNSSSLPMLYSGTIPAGVNHLRLGEGILLGRETLTGNFLPDLYQDVFIVEAEVLQVQVKGSVPDGETGFDAFGRVPAIPEIEAGIRLLLNIGHQDTPLSGLTPIDPDFSVLGGSSDYLVLASRKPKIPVGTRVQFLPNYWSVLGLMSSLYVAKVYQG